MQRLVARAVYSDPWINKVGLAAIATGTALFFALPLDTFATFPASYRLLAEVMPQGAWAAAIGGVAAVTWAALWCEATATDVAGVRRAEVLCGLAFGWLHGPLWWFFAYSVISATPAAYFPWWSMAAFVLAEWLAWQPTVQRWWERHGEGRSDGGER